MHMLSFEDNSGLAYEVIKTEEVGMAKMNEYIPLG